MQTQDWAGIFSGSLAGKPAVVSGRASGIGLPTAKASPMLARE